MRGWRYCKSYAKNKNALPAKASDRLMSGLTRQKDKSRPILYDLSVTVAHVPNPHMRQSSSRTPARRTY